MRTVQELFNVINAGGFTSEYMCIKAQRAAMGELITKEEKTLVEETAMGFVKEINPLFGSLKGAVNYELIDKLEQPNLLEETFRENLKLLPLKIYSDWENRHNTLAAFFEEFKEGAE